MCILPYASVAAVQNVKAVQWKRTSLGNFLSPSLRGPGNITQSDPAQR